MGDLLRAEVDDLDDPSGSATVSDAPGDEERVDTRLIERYPLI